MSTLSFSMYKADPNAKHLRYGQWFIVTYLPKVFWPELFYCENALNADIMISKWLTDNCYFNEMPPKDDAL